MELDFTRLNSLALKEFDKAEREPRPDAEPTAGERRLQRDVDTRQREIEAYKTYQENIKISSQLQTEILKGVKQGESVYNLFLKATKAISLMTHDILFYNQLEADIRAIYGTGLLESQPLEIELTAVQERLQRLREAHAREGEPEDSRQRIMNAIKAHEARVETLTEQSKNLK